MSLDNRRIAFHIGYHKTATTWLQQIFFKSHPEIVPISNSPHPWDDPFLRYLIKTPDSKFNSAHAKKILQTTLSSYPYSQENIFLISAERLSGHPYSGAYDNVRIAERVKETVLNPKILCIIRNQVDMLNSVYKQLLKEGYTGSIETLFRNNSWKTVSFDLAMYEYDTVIANYIRIFGKENVCVLPYEKMKTNLPEFLADICRFFEIPDFHLSPTTLRKKVNKSYGGYGISVIRLLNSFRSTELNPFPLFLLHHKIFRLAKLCFNRFPHKDLILSTDYKNKIKFYYHDSNLRLLDMIDTDLSPFFCRLKDI